MSSLSSTSVSRGRRWADVLLRLHVTLLATAAPLLIGRRSLETILRTFTPRDEWTVYRNVPPEEIVAAVRRRLRHPWVMRNRRCLREGLTAFYLLRLAGFPAAIRIGVYPFEPQRTQAHCWVVLENRCLTTPPTPPYVTILMHG